MAVQPLVKHRYLICSAKTHSKYSSFLYDKHKIDHYIGCIQDLNAHQYRHCKSRHIYSEILGYFPKHILRRCIQTPPHPKKKGQNLFFLGLIQSKTLLISPNIHRKK